MLREEGNLVFKVWVFKYLGYVLDELETGGEEYCRKVARGRKVMGVFRSIMNSIF